jgi:CBS domain-containing protein
VSEGDDDMQVRNVMSTPVMSVGTEVSVAAAARLLAEHRFTAVPVVEDGELVGIVTEIDLLQGRVHHDARSPLLAAELAAGPPPPTVGDVMAVDVLMATPTTDLADLVDSMRARHVRSVPVVAGGLRGREVVGMVTRRDILAAIARDDDQLARDVRNRLQHYALPERWHIEVNDGLVTLGDPFDDETERHTAAVLAGSVRGVVGVRVGSTKA